MTPDLVVRSSDHTPIAVRRFGEGPALVVVPGALFAGERWSACMPLLAAGRSVYLIDRRGRGGSGDAPTYEPEREVEDVRAVVDAVGAGGAPVDLLGHSSGAVLSLQLAEHAPPSLRRLVLYEPPVFSSDEDGSPDDLPERLDALLTAGDRDAALETFLREGPRMPEEEIDSARADEGWAGLVAIAHTVTNDSRIVRGFVLDASRLAAVRVPALMLIGGASPARMRRAAEAVVAMLPDVTVEDLPGQGHVAMLTAPAMFADAVDRFLSAPD